MANGKSNSSGPRKPAKPADGLSSLRKGKGLGKISKRIGAMKKAAKRKNDLMRPGKSASPDNPIEVKKGGRIKSVSQMAQKASRMESKKLQGGLKNYKKLIKKKMKRGGRAK